MRKQAAFTLIELLVVVAIIVVLIAILMPSLSRARAQAKSVQCMSNMKQLGTGFYMYAQENNDHLPLGWASGGVAAVSNPTYGADPRSLCEWQPGPVGMGRLLPMLGFTAPMTYTDISANRPKYVLCPSAPEYEAGQPMGASVYPHFIDYAYWRDGLDPAMDPANSWAHFGGKLNSLSNRCLSWCLSAGLVSVRYPGGHMDGSTFLFGDGHVEHLNRSQYTAYQAADWAWWEEDLHWRH